MVEFRLKNYNGQVYFKEELRDILQSNPLRCIANSKAVVLFSEGTDIETVLSSLEVIVFDLQHRLSQEKEGCETK
jgi:hypothetical protein